MGNRFDIKTARRIAIGVLIVAALSIVLGLWQGQEQSVFRKAALICFECIGIG